MLESCFFPLIAYNSILLWNNSFELYIWDVNILHNNEKRIKYHYEFLFTWSHCPTVP